MTDEMIEVGLENEKKRLDLFLAQTLSEHLSRSQIKKIIERGDVKVNGAVQPTPHYAVKQGEKIEVSWGPQTVDVTMAENIPLKVIAEDEDIVLINKDAGIVVHPAHGNPTGTMVNALLYHFKELSDGGSLVRPGIVHRLDKDTSGIMIIAKNDKTHAALAKLFKRHTIDRIYRVVVKGIVQHDEGICEEPIGRAFLNRKKIVIRPSGGKNATTRYSVIQRFKKSTLLEVRPITGRTHQIRVHMGHIGHPVIGDAFYGVESPWIKRQAVHAFALRFIHPTTRKEVYYEAPLPEDIKELLKQLENSQA